LFVIKLKIHFSLSLWTNW